MATVAAPDDIFCPVTRRADAADLQLLTSALASDALDRLGRRDQTVMSPIRPLRPGYRLVGRAFPVSIVASAEVPGEPYAGEMRAIELLEPGDVAVYATEPDVRAASAAKPSSPFASSL